MSGKAAARPESRRKIQAQNTGSSYIGWKSNYKKPASGINIPGAGFII